MADTADRSPQSTHYPHSPFPIPGFSNIQLEASGKFFRLGVKAVVLSLVTLCTLPFSMHNSHVHEKYQTSKATRGLRLRATRRTLAIIFTGASPKVCGAKATEEKNIKLLILTFLALTFPCTF